MKKRYTSDGRYVLQTGEYERKGQKGFIYKWRDAQGAQCSVSALTLKELREKEKEVKIARLEGRISSKERKTVNDFYNVWYSQKKRSTIKKNVLSVYVYTYQKYISNSSVGKARVGDLKKSDIIALYNNILDKGIAASTLTENIHSILHQVLQIAVDDDIIRKNPAEGAIKGIKAKPKDMPTALTPEEQLRFVEVIKDSRWEAVFIFMLHTGLRVAEVSALCWSDIDNDFISVKRNLVNYRDYSGDKKNKQLMKREIQTPKTKTSIRFIPIDEEARRALEIQKRAPANIDEIESEEGKISGFVFTNRDRRCFDQTNLNRALKRIVKKANAAAANEEGAVLLPNMHCHMLRKTYCTNLARAGVPLVIASRLMGHANIEMTANTYTEVQMDMRAEASELLEAYFKSLKKK